MGEKIQPLVGQIGGIPDLQGARRVVARDLCVTDVWSEGDCQQAIVCTCCSIEDLAVLACVRGVVTAGHVAILHTFEYGELLDVVPERIVSAIVPERICTAIVPECIAATTVPECVVVVIVPECVVLAFVPERVVGAVVPERIVSAIVPERVS